MLADVLLVVLGLVEVPSAGPIANALDATDFAVGRSTSALQL